MRKWFAIWLVFIIPGFLSAQERKVDSLQKELLNARFDTARVDILNALSDFYANKRHDSALFYITKSIELAERIKYFKGMLVGYGRISYVLGNAGFYKQAYEYDLKRLKIAEQLKKDRLYNMAEAYSGMILTNTGMQNDSAVFDEALKAIQLYKDAGIVEGMGNLSHNPFGALANIYLKRNRLDSAIYYSRKSFAVSSYYPAERQAALSVSATGLARTYAGTGHLDSARKYYQFGLGIAQKSSAVYLRTRMYNKYAWFLKNVGQTDSSIYYSRLALELGNQNNFNEYASDAANLLSSTFDSLQRPDSALKYLKLVLSIRDTIFSQSKLLEFQILNFDEGQRQKDIEAAKERYRNQVSIYGLIGTAAVFLIIALLLYRNNRNKQRANKILELQKKEINSQRNIAESALIDLKSTQSQLIQSEKMASLGEMTAGIAHEIQNPLNFVNNFSEVNKELADELKQKLKSLTITGEQKKDIIGIADDLVQNEEKISHHGKRADAIVKGMLQHSRTSQGQKESLDINAIVDEWLRLSYHGMRAKDKLFNAKFTAELDESLGKVNIVPQDIGRALGNLFNNAFYSINEKKKGLDGEYEPLVIITTKKIEDGILISIKDNGLGIPQKIIDKIFQPFFTTKPTGQGTGLGLSLTYDIITKEHGGNIKVETKEGEYAEFIILLPLSENHKINPA